MEVGASLLKSTAGDIYIAPGEGTDTNIYKLNTTSNTWQPLPNDIADGGPISGQSAFLSEGKNGDIYNIFQSAGNAFTGIVFNPANLSTNELSLESNIGIYPNPFKNSFNIKLPKTLRGDYTYELIDSSGKLVLKSNVNQNHSEILTNDLIKGLYILNIKDDSSKTIMSKKIIKK